MAFWKKCLAIPFAQDYLIYFSLNTLDSLDQVDQPSDGKRSRASPWWTASRVTLDRGSRAMRLGRPPSRSPLGFAIAGELQ